ncbi:MAG: phage tail assembly protein [Lachnospiraceae bacterium]|nr:phage tail assembly protein [Lachnospiraceae bacterium]
MELITEFEFELPRGYVDGNGEVHKRGTMRLATAADEILPLRDPRVKDNPAYLTIILLSRVVTQLGTMTNIRPVNIEKLFSADLAFLQNMYQRINSMDALTERCVCPHCGEKFEKPVNFMRAE